MISQEPRAKAEVQICKNFLTQDWTTIHEIEFFRDWAIKDAKKQLAHIKSAPEQYGCPVAVRILVNGNHLVRENVHPKNEKTFSNKNGCTDLAIAEGYDW